MPPVPAHQHAIVRGKGHAEKRFVVGIWKIEGALQSGVKSTLREGGKQPIYRPGGKLEFRPPQNIAIFPQDGVIPSGSEGSGDRSPDQLRAVAAG